MTTATAAALVVLGRGLTRTPAAWELTPQSKARVVAAAGYVATHRADFARAAAQGRPRPIIFSGGWPEASQGAAEPPPGFHEGDLMLAMAVNLTPFATERPDPAREAKHPDPTRDAEQPDPARDAEHPDPARDTEHPDPTRDAEQPDPARAAEAEQPDPAPGAGAGVARLLAEVSSRSTLENLVNSAPLLAGLTFSAGEPLGLVAHAGHLRRARYLARKVLSLRDEQILDIPARGPDAADGVNYAVSRLGFLGAGDPATLLRRERTIVAVRRRLDRLRGLPASGRPPGNGG